MLEKVKPWVELARVFARSRRRRSRSYRFARKSSDVLGRRYNPVTKEYELAAMSGQSTRPSLVEMQSIGLRRFHEVRKLAILLGLLNWTLCLICTYVAKAAAREGCPRKVVVAADVIAVGASLRLLWMLGMGFTQAVTASAMISGDDDASVDNENNENRQNRRKWYKLWLWWSRVGVLVTAVQVIGAAYFFYSVATNFSQRSAYSCSGSGAEDRGFKLWLVAAPVLAWAIASAQCCAGSDVIAWRALYHDHDEAWRAHYREMFDYGIREVMCCLGRRRYLSQLDKDEVDSVAALLGDLVAYRARGASHLEVVAGIALLREQKVQTLASDDGKPAPEKLLMEAAELHPYAIAAYTGFLLDLGRNPLTWLCVWLRRQGALTFWNRTRRPILEGDNWWRGHAAAFLRHARLPPEALLQGRVSQQNSTVLVRETVYFVAVLRHTKTVVVAVRGTETPEDLLTDGLGRECQLSDSDLLGLLKGGNVPDEVKKQVQDTKSHYCHIGVIKAARELSMQLDNFAEDESGEQALIDCASVRVDSEEVTLLERKPGLLTRLLGPGGTYEGYKLRFVGHSLGGSIAALTALRLYKRYPELHVYAYGVLPCVDAVTADACASFVTSVIYNDEYSSRLSVAAVMRLRNRALIALESSSETDSASLAKLAWSFFGSSEQTNSSNVRPHCPELRRSESLTTEIYEDERDNPAREQLQQQRGIGITGSHSTVDEEKQRRPCELKGESLMSTSTKDGHRHPSSLTNLDLLPNGMPKDGVEERGSDLQELWPAEMYVPGLVIHLVKEEEPSEQSLLQTFFHFMGFCEEDKAQYSAVLKDRNSFRDIVVSPNMFIDHAPWRCQHAMNEVIKKMRLPIASGSGSPELASELV